MAQVDRIEREFAHFVGEESTFGTRAGALTRMHFNQGSDIAKGLGRDLIVNARETVRRHDNPQRIKGLQNGAFGACTWNVCGVKSGDRLGAADTPVTLSHHILYKHGLGRRYAAAGCTVGVGSTATSLVVDSTAGRKAGECILVEITAGVWEPTVIEEVVDGTHLSLRYGLTSAPASSRGVRGMYTFVPAEIRNTSLTIEQKGVGAADHEHRVLGAFGNLAFAFPEAFGQPIVATLTGAGQYSHTGPGTLSPAFGAAGNATDYAPADTDMGADFVWLPTFYLDTAITRASDQQYRVESLQIEWMSSADPKKDQSAPNGIGGFLDVGGRENGVAGTVKVTIRADHAEAEAFEAQTLRSGFLYQQGTDGSFYAIDLPVMEQVGKPQPVTLGNGRAGMELSFNLLRDTTTTPDAGLTEEDKDLAWAPFRIAFG